MRQLWSREIPNFLSAHVFSWHRLRSADETNIQLAVPGRRLAGISFREKLEDDSISEISRKRNVSLQSNTLPCRREATVSQTRHGGVSSIRRHQHARFEIPGAGAHDPFAFGVNSVTVVCSKICAPSSGARDMSSSSNRLRLTAISASSGNAIATDCRLIAMNSTARVFRAATTNAMLDFEPCSNGQHDGLMQSPQTFSRGKFLAFEEQSSQTGGGTECRATRPRRSAAHDGDIKYIPVAAISLFQF